MKRVPIDPPSAPPRAHSAPRTLPALRTLPIDELEHLATDIRQEILSTCLRNGGHLGASLGAVEIAIALHVAFDSPREPILWDVGHQAYAHKLLTGRWERFSTLRQEGGISGFLSREESEHDAFGAGHSSTALSAALGVAWAQARGHVGEGPVPWTAAVVGDGGLTAGLAFEALNNLKATPTGPLVVVLNDNQMSISPNVGALPSILAGQGAADFFSHFGFEYIGPVDGHNLRELVDNLRAIRARPGARPVLLHAFTQKGKGYVPAEERPADFHGVSPLQKRAVEKVGDQPAPRARQTYSDAFGEALCELASRDPQVVAVTAAMPEGTGLSLFAERFPDRFFDVGIAEPHAVVFAAGLASRGYRPVVAIYSTFLQRALDAVIHDVALQKLGVVLAIDRAGIVGADGPTHHGAFDLAYLGAVPGLAIAAPTSLEELGRLLAESLGRQGPTAIRYPRGGGPRSLSEAVRPAAPALIAVGLGAAASRVSEAARGIDPAGARIAVISTAWAKPIAPPLLDYLRSHPGVPLLIAEDGQVRGGFGQAVLAAAGPRQAAADLAGYADHFIPHGAVGALEEREGLSAARLVERMRALLAKPAP